MNGTATALEGSQVKYAPAGTGSANCGRMVKTSFRPFYPSVLGRNVFGCHDTVSQKLHALLDSSPIAEERVTGRFHEYRISRTTRSCTLHIQGLGPIQLGRLRLDV